METVSKNILNVVYNNHRILVDTMTEGSSRVKKVVWVITPDFRALEFNVSPYDSLMDMDLMAKRWIDCGCPSDDGSKWTKESLRDCVAS